MQSYTRRFSLVGAIILLSACDTASSPTSPHAPATILPRSASNSVERSVEEYVSTYDGSFVGFECADGTQTELVELFGQVFTRNTTTLNPTGSYHLTSNSMAIGLRGVGTVTGQEYRVKEDQHYTVTQREIGYTGTNRIVFELTAKESMQTFKLVINAHLVVTPDGSVVVERQTTHSECGK